MADAGAGRKVEEDVKPNVAKAIITLKVKDQGGQETIFKVKKSTKMKKVFDAYAARKGIARGSLRFMLDGERIDDDETPDSLELEEDDQLDVMLFQEGGGCLA